MSQNNTTRSLVKVTAPTQSGQIGNRMATLAHTKFKTLELGQAYRIGQANKHALMGLLYV